MYEFLQTYSAEIAQLVFIISIFAPLIRNRVINDKKLLEKFEEVKHLTKTIDLKEIDFKILIDYLSKSIKTIEGEFLSTVDDIDNKLIGFMESDLFIKMSERLAELDEIKNTLTQKDETIKLLMNELKKIEKKLG